MSASVLAKAQSKRTISSEKAKGFLEGVKSLEIVVDKERIDTIFGEVHRLAIFQKLSGYDAAYLELALRKGLPLASLDADLNQAALAAGVNSVLV